MKIYILIGTRPNFIKVTQFKKCADDLDPDIKITIIHTGQHYDEKMADVFFRQFNLLPDHYLNISPASANKQIAEIMIKLEDLVNEIGKPDLLLVPGDVNSTLAGALFANKSGFFEVSAEAITDREITKYKLDGTKIKTFKSESVGYMTVKDDMIYYTNIDDNFSIYKMIYFLK